MSHMKLKLEKLRPKVAEEHRLNTEPMTDLPIEVWNKILEVIPSPKVGILLEATKAVDAALIVWHTWKWPKLEVES